MRDGHQSPIRVFQPASPGEPKPLVALVFGGGFISGSNLQLVPFARAIAGLYDATVVTLSYRLAPEWKFPTAPRDIWDSVVWLAENAGGQLGVDLSAGFVLGGVSAGGNLTVVTAQRALKEKLATPLTGLWACIPVTTTEKTVPARYKGRWVSREQNAGAPLLGAREIQVVEDLYQPDDLSEDYTPFGPRADSSFSRLPRTYVQVAGLDPLRDDGLIYESVLKDHGVETRLDVYPGVPHGHFAVLADLKESVRSRRDTIIGIGWLLGKEMSEEALAKLEGETTKPAESTP